MLELARQPAERTTAGIIATCHHLLGRRIVELLLPNGLALEVTHASPSWVAAMVAELVRAS